MRIIFIGIFIVALLAAIFGKLAQGEGSWFGMFFKSSGVSENEDTYKGTMKDLRRDRMMDSEKIRDTKEDVRELNERLKDQMQRLRDQRNR